MQLFRVLVVASVGLLITSITACEGGSNRGETAPGTVVPPSDLTYSTDPATYILQVSISPNLPSSGGGAVVSYAISPALPPGLDFNTSTGVISGTPAAVTSAADYLVTAINSAGSTSASLRVEVTRSCRSCTGCCLAGVCQAGTARTACGTGGSFCRRCSRNEQCTSSGCALTCDATTCPSGCCSEGICQSGGEATACGTQGGVCQQCSDPTPTCSSGMCVAASGGGVLPPTDLMYSTNPAMYTVGVSVPPNLPSSSGGAVTSYAISPALPIGLNFDISTGAITGTPVAVTNAADYLVTASNSAGSTSVEVSLAVTSSCGSCTGCCLAGACQAGTAQTACGTGGNSCQACSDDEQCTSGGCTLTCDATTCPTGCCSQGVCQSGGETTACGTQGGVCQQCSDPTPMCASGMCVAESNGVVPVTLVQNIQSSSNVTSIFGDTGQDFYFTLPNPVHAGNALVLFLNWQYPNTISSITDSQSNPWTTTPAIGTNDGSAQSAGVFVVTNAAAGITKLHVSMSAQTRPFLYSLSEFSGIATSQGTYQGSVATPTYRSAGQAMQSGSFTPNNNDANGGNLILNWLADDNDGSANASTAVTAASGFTLLDAETCQGDQTMEHASQYMVQSSVAAINPGVNLTQDATGGQFFSVSLALKAGNQGAVGSGMRIIRIHHFSSPNGVASAACQFPCSGNLLLFNADANEGQWAVSTIADTSSNGWTSRTHDSGSTQWWDAQNATCTSTMKVTITPVSGTVQASWQLIDVAGAPASPYDTTMGNPSVGEQYTGGATLNDFPDATPSTADGIMFADGGFGTGPVSGLASGSPPDAIFDFVFYTGQSDGSNMDNSDILAHYFVTRTTQATWNWTVANGNQTSNVWGSAFHYTGH